ncbi:MAG: glycosyltransferase family 4 protein [Pseudomonadota bacterium]
MRVLVITNLFPNAKEPLSAPFNKQQFVALAQLCDVNVLGVIPWFPGARVFSRFSQAGKLVVVPHTEIIDGLTVHHPRWLHIPKIGNAIAGLLFAASLFPSVWKLRKEVDVVLGSWAYPDGFASVLLGELLRVPVVVKVHGSDLNLVADMPGPRRNLRWAFPKVARLVAVSKPLGEKAVTLGVSKERVRVIYGGLDENLFHLRDRSEARAALGLKKTGRLIVFVGELKEAKGVFDLLEAFVGISKNEQDLSLVLVGDGEDRAACEARVAESGGKVTLVGARPLEEVALWMSAADTITLPSWNEGTPNVLLEALACGRKVVATRVGGIPDLIDSPKLGELVPAKDLRALGEALVRVAREDYDPAEVTATRKTYSWAKSAKKLCDVLVEAVEMYKLESVGKQGKSG